MDVSGLNNINPLLNKLSKEKNQVFLLGDLNINLLNYNDHQPTNECLDYLASNSFIPYILQENILVSPKHSSIMYSPISFLMKSFLLT